MNYTNRTKPQLIQEIRQLQSELADIKQMTEQRSAELHKSEERFSLAMRGANDGLWDWNLETNEVYYSLRWKSMLGFTEEELENNFDTWASLVHPEDKEKTLTNTNEYVAGLTDSIRS